MQSELPFQGRNNKMILKKLDISNEYTFSIEKNDRRAFLIERNLNIAELSRTKICTFFLLW